MFVKANEASFPCGKKFIGEKEDQLLCNISQSGAS